MKTVRNVLITLIVSVLFFNWPQIFQIPMPVLNTLFATVGIGYVLYGLRLVFINRRGERLESKVNRGLGHLCIVGGVVILSMMWAARDLLAIDLSDTITSLKQYAPYSLILVLMLLVFTMAFLSRTMRNGDYNKTNVTSKICSTGILICAMFIGLWPWVIVGKQSLSLGQLQGIAWLSFIAAALIVGVGPIVTGLHFGRRSQFIA